MVLTAQRLPTPPPSTVVLSPAGLCVHVPKMLGEPNINGCTCRCAFPAVSFNDCHWTTRAALQHRRTASPCVVYHFEKVSTARHLVCRDFDIGQRATIIFRSSTLLLHTRPWQKKRATSRLTPLGQLGNKKPTILKALYNGALHSNRSLGLVLCGFLGVLRLVQSSSFPNLLPFRRQCPVLPSYVSELRHRVDLEVGQSPQFESHLLFSSKHLSFFFGVAETSVA